MIKIRLDVDYAYPSRNKSLICTALKIRPKKDYLKNSKIIAKMVNETQQEIMAYWFFTPLTLPDQDMMEKMNSKRHEVALHIAIDPYKELKSLETLTNQKLRYYTIHGTERLLGRIIWGRKLGQARVPIPVDFPLQNFWDFPTLSLDRFCYDKTTKEAVKMAQENVSEDKVLHVHPDWLFKKGKFNHRGPYYEVLRELLDVDEELEELAVRKKGFIKIGRYSEQFEYIKDVNLSERFFNKLKDRDVDVFTFIERSWCNSLTFTSSDKWIKTEDNIALLQIDTFDGWWEKIGKKTRNMVRKAEKSGVRAEIVEPSDKLAECVWRIYNETPVRQGRAFSHYGQSLESVKDIVFNTKNCVFIGACVEEELVGFIQLVYGDNLVVMTQILSLQKYWDKAVNNVLLSKAVEVCTSGNHKWLMYGRMGKGSNHPSLDKFKENNGFVRYPLNRYYVVLSGKGGLAVKLGFHRQFRDRIPESLKPRVISFYNFISRTKIKLAHRD
ncbi:MAG: hypothetical protein FWF66_02655 [Candidatus Bathyarchaeota archaeon]|nr:hypothetical protein [Candidatus Termiticorpusculum sp.]MCL1970343.1 hypothetical protein [Candidatus Termiticorpusculum sp.]